MEPTFEFPNESAKEQKERLAKITRTVLVADLEAVLKRVKGKSRELPVEFILQTRPFSTNSMSGRRKTFETKEYIEFRSLIAMKAGGNYGISKTDKFRLYIEAGFSFKRADLDNVAKPLLDSMVASMDDIFDDSQIFEIHAKKVMVKKGYEYLKVRMEKM